MTVLSAPRAAPPKPDLSKPENHYLERSSYAGTYGDHPSPWEVTFLCAGCREVLWEEFEGGLRSIATPDEALEEHLIEYFQLTPEDPRWDEVIPHRDVD